LTFALIGHRRKWKRSTEVGRRTSENAENTF